MIRIIQADVMDGLAQLGDESIHMVATSPPYWGLRDYGIPASIWGGDPACEHEWGASQRKGGGSHTHTDTSQQNGVGSKAAHEQISSASTGQFCHHCAAWRGCLGLEPTPELYVEHIVAVFREVWRVLRSDGTCWINLGDSYSNDTKWGGTTGGIHAAGIHGQTGIGRGRRFTGLKPKDLVMIPERVVLALQADGWWVRSRIPWLKRNSMPESVTDRPATATEYVFLLSKSQRYYFDAEAVKKQSSPGTHARLSQDVDDNQIGSDRAHAGGKTNGNMKAVGQRPGNNGVGFGHGYDKDPKERVNGRRPKAWDSDMGSQRTLITGHPRKLADPGSGTKNNASFDEAMAVMPPTRNRRNSDWFMESWQGLLLNEDDEPLASIVNPQPFKAAHFATFPPKLVEPMILASSSERGCCPECAAPWERVVEKSGGSLGKSWHDHADDIGRGQREDDRAAANGWEKGGYCARTVGWRPTCKCVHDTLVARGAFDGPLTVERASKIAAEIPHLAPVPATVLDCFGGAGTVGLVADRLQRSAVLIEIKPEYVDMARARIDADAPLFAEYEVQQPAIPLA